MFVLGYDEKMKDAILGTAGPRKIRRRWWSDLGYNQIYHGILPISLHCLARARPRMPVCSSLSIWIWTCRPAEHHPKHSRHSQEYSLELGILGGTSDMGMDQYLLIAVIGDEHPFTSYFEVHQGYKVLTHPHIRGEKFHRLQLWMGHPLDPCEPG